MLVTISFLFLQSCSYEDDVGTTLLRGAEGTTLGEPVSFGVVLNPVGDGGLLGVRDSLVRVANTLENVVLVLGDSENTRSGLGNCLAIRMLWDYVSKVIATYRTKSRRRLGDG